jgi:hypothetical protein
LGSGMRRAFCGFGLGLMPNMISCFPSYNHVA